MESSILIPLSTGQVAAVLTAIEFVLGAIVIASVQKLLSGIWLIWLHREGNSSLNTKKQRFRNIRKEIPGFLLALLLTVFVAIVESQLREQRSVSTRTKNSYFCANATKRYNLVLLNIIQPPSSFKIDETSPEVARNLKCEYGIGSIEFGSDGFVLDPSESFFIPTCNDGTSTNTTAKMALSYTHSISTMYVSDDTLKIDEYDKPFYLFPYSLPEFGFDGYKFREKEVLEPLASCEKNNLSSVATVATEWRIREVDDLFVARQVLSSLCESQQAWKKKDVLRIKDINSCSEFFADEIKPKCLKKKAKKSGARIFSTELHNFSALFVVDNLWNARSYACTNISFQYEYVLAPEKYMMKKFPLLLNSSRNSKAVIIPTELKVYSGNCEYTPHVVGLSALIYATRTEWNTEMDKEFSGIDRHQRYYAYLMSIARSAFPYEEINITKRNNASCKFQMVDTKTRVDLNWSFYLMVSILVLAILMLICTLICSLAIPQYSWKFMSTLEALTTLASQSDLSGNMSIPNLNRNNTAPIDTVSEDHVEMETLREKTIFVKAEKVNPPSSYQNEDTDGNEENSTRSKKFSYHVEVQ